MITLLATLVLLPQAGVSAASPEATAQALGFKYDPNNGLMDYLHANAILRSDDYPMYALIHHNAKAASEQTYSFGGSPEEVAKSQERYKKLQDRLTQLRHLERLREMRDKFKRATDSIEAARKKSVWDPMDGSEPSSFALQSYRQLHSSAQFLTEVMAPVERAEGHPIQATAHILDALRIADFMESANVFGSALVRGQALRSIANDAERLSLPECSALNKYVVDYLGKGVPMSGAMLKTVKNTTDLISKAFQLDARVVIESGLRNGSLEAEIRAIPPAARPAYSVRSQAIIEKEAKEVIELLSKDEAAWVAYLNHPDHKVNQLTPASPTDPIDVKVAIHFKAEKIRFPPYVERALTLTTQMRLLRASNAVIEFRWMNGYYPASLKDAAPTEIITDRVTGKPFRYRVIGSGFEIIATGSNQTGDIKLGWERPVGRLVSPPPVSPGSQLPSVRPRSERE